MTSNYSKVSFAYIPTLPCKLRTGKVCCRKICLRIGTQEDYRNMFLYHLSVQNTSTYGHGLMLPVALLMLMFSFQVPSAITSKLEPVSRV